MIVLGGGGIGEMGSPSYPQICRTSRGSEDALRASVEGADGKMIAARQSASHGPVCCTIPGLQ